MVHPETPAFESEEVSPVTDDVENGEATSTERISSDSSDVQAEIEQTGVNQLEQKDDSTAQINLQNELKSQKQNSDQRYQPKTKMGKNPAIDVVFFGLKILLCFTNFE